MKENAPKSDKSLINIFYTGFANIKQQIKNHKRLTYLLVFLFIFDLAAFSYFTEKQPFSLITPSFNEETNLIDVTLFLPDKDMTSLIQTKRQIYPYEKNTEKVRAIFNELATRPSKAGTIRAIPSETQLRRVWIHEKIIYIDLRKNIYKIKLLKKEQEQFLFYGLTKSLLTNMPEFKGVRFLVDGKEVDTIWGAIDLTMPLVLREVKSSNPNAPVKKEQ